MLEILTVPLANAPLPSSFFGKSAEGSLAWFQTLAATTLSAGETAILALAKEGGSLFGALPLVRAEAGVRALTAPYTTRYTPALPIPEAAYELGKRARAYAGGVLRLDALDPADSGTAAFLQGLGASGLAVAGYEGFANWHEPISTFGDYWEKRPSRLRSTVRRKLAAANRAGASFTCIRADFDQAIAVYGEIYSSSWKVPEAHPQFIATMVRELGREGFIRIGLMSMVDRPVAAQIWLVSGGKATIFKLAHREDATEHSPGTLLTFWMAETLIRTDNVTEIDFGRGDDGYKRDWVSVRSTRTGVIAADWRHIRGLAALVRDVVPTRIGRALRRHLAGNRNSSVE